MVKLLARVYQVILELLQTAVLSVRALTTVQAIYHALIKNAVTLVQTPVALTQNVT